jgi:hypothetical protein
MPEATYRFKPVDAVRTYGQIVGHIADMQYAFCSVALGEKNPALRVEQTKTSKAELVAALKDAIAYCDRAYDALTDASAVQPRKMGPNEMPLLSVLHTNIRKKEVSLGCGPFALAGIDPRARRTRRRSRLIACAETRPSGRQACRRASRRGPGRHACRCQSG